jgi:hypothetical protein
VALTFSCKPQSVQVSPRVLPLMTQAERAGRLAVPAGDPPALGEEAVAALGPDDQSGNNTLSGLGACPAAAGSAGENKTGGHRPPLQQKEGRHHKMVALKATAGSSRPATARC